MNIFCFYEILASFDGDVGRYVCRSFIKCSLPLIRLFVSFALLGCYTPYVEHSLPTFRDRLSVRSSRVLGLTLEDGTDGLFTNVGSQLSTIAAKDSEEWRSSGYLSNMARHMDRCGEDDTCIFATLFAKTPQKMLLAATVHS